MTSAPARRSTRLALALIVLLLVLPASPAPADESPYLSVGVLEAQGSKLIVGGSIRFDYGPSSTWEAEDPFGDASVPERGLDLRGAHVVPFSDSGQLLFTLSLDGHPDRPIVPPNAYSWPLRIGADRHVWLGAGAPGTGMPPSAEWWQAMCSTQSGVSVECSKELSTFIISSGVQWLVPIAPDYLPAGSVIESGYMNGGAISSFAWPPVNVAGSQVTTDTMGAFPAYRVPGQVRFAIAPAGTPQSELDYDQATTVNFEPGPIQSYSGVIDGPAEPGDYEVHARSCWGLLSSEVCVSDVTTLEI